MADAAGAVAGRLVAACTTAARHNTDSTNLTMLPSFQKKPKTSKLKAESLKLKAETRIGSAVFYFSF
jgi:hypothetical protein